MAVNREVFNLFHVSVEIGDLIDLLNLLVTAGVGIWIGVNFHKKHTSKVALKEYFIFEIKSINESYSDFIKSIYACNKPASKIVEWFKIMTIKLNILSENLSLEYSICTEILSTHNELKKFLTGLDEFNESYNNKVLKLRPAQKQALLESYSSFKKGIINTIISVQKK